MDARLEQKYEALKENIKGMGRVAVAFSAGVDSTLLLAAAAEALGERVLAVSVEADWVPRREQHEAQDFCSSRTIRRIRLNVRAEDIPGFAENPPERCYLCKRVLFTKILEAARANGIDCVLEGSNTDDLTWRSRGSSFCWMRAFCSFGCGCTVRLRELRCFRRKWSGF